MRKGSQLEIARKEFTETLVISVGMNIAYISSCIYIYQIGKKEEFPFLPYASSYRLEDYSFFSL